MSGVYMKCEKCRTNYYTCDWSEWKRSGNIVRNVGYCGGCMGLSKTGLTSQSNSVDLHCKECNYWYFSIDWNDWSTSGNLTKYYGFCTNCYYDHKQGKKNYEKKIKLVEGISEYKQRKIRLNYDLAKENRTLEAKKPVLEKILDEISKEEKEIEYFDEERENTNNKLIVVIGKTGFGKSTFCNRFMGDISKTGNDPQNKFFKTRFGATAVTSKIQCKRTTKNNTKYCIVDTPGSFDTQNRDIKHSNELCNFLKGCGGINAFLIVLDLNSRFSKELQDLIKEYENIMGGRMWSHVIIIFTKLDMVLYNYENPEDHKKEWENEFKKIFNNWPKCIMIGRNNYKTAIKKLLEIIPNNKYNCEAIKSPLDELKETKNQLQNQIERINEKIQQLQNKIRDIDVKIEGSQTTLNTL